MKTALGMAALIALCRTQLPVDSTRLPAPRNNETKIFKSPRGVTALIGKPGPHGMRYERALAEITDLTHSKPPYVVKIEKQQGRVWIIQIKVNDKTYALQLKIPRIYPFAPPQIVVLKEWGLPNTPHVDPEGNICLNLLSEKEWKPTVKLRFVLDCIYELFSAPKDGAHSQAERWLQTTQGTGSADHGDANWAGFVSGKKTQNSDYVFHDEQ